MFSFFFSKTLRSQIRREASERGNAQPEQEVLQPKRQLGVRKSQTSVLIGELPVRFFFQCCYASLLVSSWGGYDCALQLNIE